MDRGIRIADVLNTDTSIDQTHIRDELTDSKGAHRYRAASKQAESCPTPEYSSFSHIKQPKRDFNHHPAVFQPSVADQSSSSLCRKEPLAIPVRR